MTVNLFSFVHPSIALELEKKKETKQREREAKEKEARKRDKAEEKERKRKEYNAHMAALAIQEQKNKRKEKKKRNGQIAAGMQWACSRLSLMQSCSAHVDYTAHVTYSHLSLQIRKQQLNPPPKPEDARLLACCSSFSCWDWLASWGCVN